MLNKRFRLVVMLTLTIALFASYFAKVSAQSNVVELNFYYPTAVGGAISQLFDKYAAEFTAANPDIKINSTYVGGYDDIYKAVQTQISGGGAGPDVAIFLAADLYSLIDNDYIVPMTDFIKNTPDGDKYVDDFYPAFLANATDAGVLWAMPFQRSTPVLYYNKDMFKEAGLDPDKAPETWQDMLDYAKKLTKADGSRWGLMIPSDGFPYWLFQGFAISNGQNLVGDEANKVYFNTPSTVEALQFFVDLANKDGVMPKGIIKWGDTPTAFNAGQVAMIYHTTGSLTNILANAKFDVGVGFLPKGKAGYGAPTGGGNLYILKNSSPEKQAAAWKWIQFLTSPEKQADWTVNTGYIAARKSAWEVEALKNLVAEKPQYAVARDQLEFAGKELSTHSGLEVRQTFGKAVAAALTEEKTVQQALDDAQSDAEKLLADFQ
ncbi:MAG: ABC transporter substrate-binding protein [Anaerolineae bacterium]|nr:ABC transporter substrate-binding protein [Anaerolineae bacterium]